MKKIYFSPSCSSVKKTFEFFDQNQIAYIKHNIIKEPLTKTEIKMLLQLAPNGVNDIISSKAKFIKTHAINIETLRLSEIYQLITNEPKILRRPIIVDLSMKKLVAGYNEDEIEIFLRNKLES